MNGQLAGRTAGTHAFVFGHKGIITENHVDTLFGANPASRTRRCRTPSSGTCRPTACATTWAATTTCTTAPSSRAPTARASVEDITLASDSSKFYIPYGSAGYDKRAGGPDHQGCHHHRRRSLRPIRRRPTTTSTTSRSPAARCARPRSPRSSTRVGYYVFTVCGPKVTRGLLLRRREPHAEQRSSTCSARRRP